MNATRQTSTNPASILMLLSNAYEPDARVRQEALALLRMGCRVRILAWDRDLKHPPLEVMEGIEVERVFLPSVHGRGTMQLFFYAWLYLKLIWRGWRNQWDAIHCHDLDTLPAGFLLGKVKRKPVIFDAHESFTDMIAGSVHPAVRRTLYLLENFLIRRVDLLITVGEKIRRFFEGRGAKRAVVVGNWKRLEEYTRSEAQIAAIRQRLSIPPSALTIVCITHLLKDRKLEEFLDAVDECPDVYALIGGNGVMEDFVREKAAKNPRIVYVGFVRGKDIPEYTCAGDVVYYGCDPGNPNTRFSAPNKLYEALAAGRPLITGDFGEIADTVRRASCGIVLPEYSTAEIRKAIEAMRSVSAREAMAANAGRFGREAMNWQKGEEILYQEYARLIAAPLKQNSYGAVGVA